MVIARGTLQYYESIKVMDTPISLPEHKMLTSTHRWLNSCLLCLLLPLVFVSCKGIPDEPDRSLTYSIFNVDSYSTLLYSLRVSCASDVEICLEEPYLLTELAYRIVRFAWSPNGAVLLFHGITPNDPFGRLYLYFRDSEQVAIVSTGDDRVMSQFAWSPDGTNLAYQTCETDSGACSLWIRNLENASVQTLEIKANEVSSHAIYDWFTGDGQEWLLIQGYDRHGLSQVYVWGLQEGNFLQLTNNVAGSYSPAISTSGELLAYFSPVADIFDMKLYILDLETGLADEVLSEYDVYSPSWAPDMKWIAGIARYDDDRNSILIWNASGSSITRLDRGERIEQVEWLVEID